MRAEIDAYEANLVEGKRNAIANDANAKELFEGMYGNINSASSAILNSISIDKFMDEAYALAKLRSDIQASSTARANFSNMGFGDINNMSLAVLKNLNLSQGVIDEIFAETGINYSDLKNQIEGDAAALELFTGLYGASINTAKLQAVFTSGADVDAFFSLARSLNQLRSDIKADTTASANFTMFGYGNINTISLKALNDLHLTQTQIDALFTPEATMDYAKIVSDLNANADAKALFEAIHGTVNEANVQSAFSEAADVTAFFNEVVRLQNLIADINNDALAKSRFTEQYGALTITNLYNKNLSQSDIDALFAPVAGMDYTQIITDINGDSDAQALFVSIYGAVNETNVKNAFADADAVNAFFGKVNSLKQLMNDINANALAKQRFAERFGTLNIVAVNGLTQAQIDELFAPQQGMNYAQIIDALNADSSAKELFESIYGAVNEANVQSAFADDSAVDSFFSKVDSLKKLMSDIAANTAASQRFAEKYGALNIVAVNGLTQAQIEELFAEGINYQNVLDALSADPQALELFRSKYGTPNLAKLADIFKTPESIDAFFSRVDSLKKLMSDIAANTAASQRFAEKYGALTITAADALTQAQIEELFAAGIDYNSVLGTITADAEAAELFKAMFGTEPTLASVTNAFKTPDAIDGFFSKLASLKQLMNDIRTNAVANERFTEKYGVLTITAVNGLTQAQIEALFAEGINYANVVAALNADSNAKELFESIYGAVTEENAKAAFKTPEAIDAFFSKVDSLKKLMSDIAANTTASQRFAEKYGALNIVAVNGLTQAQIEELFAEGINYQNVLDALSADPQALELFRSKYGTPNLAKLADIFKTPESIDAFFSRVDSLKKLMSDIAANTTASQRFAEKYGALTITAADALTQAQIEELFAAGINYQDVLNALTADPQAVELFKAMYGLDATLANVTAIFTTPDKIDSFFSRVDSLKKLMSDIAANTTASQRFAEKYGALTITAVNGLTQAQIEELFAEGINYQNVLDALNADAQALALFTSKYGTPTLAKLADVFKTPDSIDAFFSRVDSLKKLMSDIAANTTASQRFAEKYGALTITAADALTQAQIEELFAEGIDYNQIMSALSADPQAAELFTAMYNKPVTLENVKAVFTTADIIDSFFSRVDSLKKLMSDIAANTTASQRFAEKYGALTITNVNKLTQAQIEELFAEGINYQTVLNAINADAQAVELFKAMFGTSPTLASVANAFKTPESIDSFFSKLDSLKNLIDAIRNDPAVYEKYTQKYGTLNITNVYKLTQAQIDDLFTVTDYQAVVDAINADPQAVELFKAMFNRNVTLENVKAVLTNGEKIDAFFSKLDSLKKLIDAIRNDATAFERYTDKYGALTITNVYKLTQAQIDELFTQGINYQDVLNAITADPQAVELFNVMYNMPVTLDNVKAVFGSGEAIDAFFSKLDSLKKLIEAIKNDSRALSRFKSRYGDLTITNVYKLTQAQIDALFGDDQYTGNPAYEALIERLRQHMLDTCDRETLIFLFGKDISKLTGKAKYDFFSQFIYVQYEANGVTVKETLSEEDAIKNFDNTIELFRLLTDSNAYSANDSLAVKLEKLREANPDLFRTFAFVTGCELDESGMTGAYQGLVQLLTTENVLDIDLHSSETKTITLANGQKIKVSLRTYEAYASFKKVESVIDQIENFYNEILNRPLSDYEVYVMKIMTGYDFSDMKDIKAFAVSYFFNDKGDIRSDAKTLDAKKAWSDYRKAIMVSYNLYSYASGNISSDAKAMLNSLGYDSDNWLKDWAIGSMFTTDKNGNAILSTTFHQLAKGTAWEDTSVSADYFNMEPRVLVDGINQAAKVYKAAISDNGLKASTQTILSRMFGTDFSKGVAQWCIDSMFADDAANKNIVLSDTAVSLKDGSLKASDYIKNLNNAAPYALKLFNKNGLSDATKEDLGRLFNIDFSREGAYAQWCLDVMFDNDGLSATYTSLADGTMTVNKFFSNTETAAAQAIKLLEQSGNLTQETKDILTKLLGTNFSNGMGQWCYDNMFDADGNLSGTCVALANGNIDAATVISNINRAAAQANRLYNASSALNSDAINALKILFGMKEFNRGEWAFNLMFSGNELSKTLLDLESGKITPSEFIRQINLAAPQALKLYNAAINGLSDEAKKYLQDLFGADFETQIGSWAYNSMFDNESSDSFSNTYRNLRDGDSRIASVLVEELNVAAKEASKFYDGANRWLTDDAKAALNHLFGINFDSDLAVKQWSFSLMFDSEGRLSALAKRLSTSSDAKDIIADINTAAPIASSFYNELVSKLSEEDLAILAEYFGYDGLKLWCYENMFDENGRLWNGLSMDSVEAFVERTIGMLDAIKSGKGAFIRVIGDTALFDIQNQKNAILEQYLADQKAAEEAALTGEETTAAVEEEAVEESGWTKFWRAVGDFFITVGTAIVRIVMNIGIAIANFFRWMFGYEALDYYPLVSSAAAEEAPAEPVQPNLKGQDRESVLSLLGSVTASENVYDSNNELIGIYETSIIDAREITAEEAAQGYGTEGDFIFIYERSFYNLDAAGKKGELQASNYFAEYNNKFYEVWFHKDMANMIADELAIDFTYSASGTAMPSGISSALENELAKNNYKILGEIEAMFMIGDRDSMEVIFDISEENGIVTQGQAVFTKDANGNTIVTVSTRMKAADGNFTQWTTINAGANGSFTFTYKNGDGVLNPDLKFLNHNVDTDNRVVSAYKLSDIVDNPEFSSVINMVDGVVQNVYMARTYVNESGETVEEILNQVYGEMFQLNSSIATAINGTSMYLRNADGSIRTDENGKKQTTGVVNLIVSPLEVAWGGKTVVMDNGEVVAEANTNELDINDTDSQAVKDNKEAVTEAMAKARVTYSNGAAYDSENTGVSHVTEVDSLDENGNATGRTEKQGLLTLKGSTSGATGTGTTYLVRILDANTDGSPRYEIIKRVSSYNTYSFDHVSENMGNQDWYNRIAPLFEMAQNSEIGFNYNPGDLTWAKTDVLDENGEVMYTTWGGIQPGKRTACR